MNPFLEQADGWEDFHQDFLVRARETLMAEVGENYVVKIEARLYLHELSAEERRFFGRADVAIDVDRQAFLEIRDRRNRRIVTVVELLSPANKTPGADRDAYLGKRGEILAGQTHLVEIDFRRGGTRPHPPELPPCDYYALVSRLGRHLPAPSRLIRLVANVTLHRASRRHLAGRNRRPGLPVGSSNRATSAVRA